MDRGNPNIDHWLGVLREKVKLDAWAIMSLQQLAAMGRAGYMHANSIIGKCFKKTNDYTVPFPYPSRFVVSCVNSAIEQIARTGS
jgi:hypothetical protein